MMQRFAPGGERPALREEPVVSRLACVLLLAGCAAPALAASTAASEYPAKPIRMIVGFSAGGGSDFAARIVGHKLTELLGQPVVIDNRTGANGAIAAELAARAPADGYTLMMLAIAQAIGAAHGTRLPYDLLRDFAPVSQATQQPYLVVTTLALPVRTTAELIALAREKPGKLNYASTGVGGSNHLATEIFSAAAGIRMHHVPYKGPPPALADVIGGQVEVMFSSIVTGLPLARGGKLRPIAVSSLNRSRAAPEVPAIAETLPGFEAIGWYGVVAPRGTPRAVVERLAAAIGSGMQSPEVRERVAGDGSEAVGSSPEAFERFLRAEMARFARVIRDIGIRPE
jgi:tripartite-type tricarboxylate transporter receptor subunit TctC